jgi:hypothetical protein
MSRSIRISPKIGLLDDGNAYGFPFAAYFVWVGLPKDTGFIWPGALLNLAIALLGSLLIGLMLRKLVESKLTLR